jgi:hypothetical protein
MIMFDKKVPNFWTWTRTEVRSVGGGAVTVTMLVLSESAVAAPLRPG